MHEYDPRAYPAVAVTVDLVVLTIRAGSLTVLLVTRGEEPFKGCPALPGGFVRAEEDLGRAAARELREETGLVLGGVHLEQLASYGDPHRDPRMRVVTVAYLALAPGMPSPRAGTDAAEAAWVPVTEAAGWEGLAFDHRQILADGVERARAKLEYTPLAAAFCPPEFTIAQLRQVYETVWGTSLDPRNFHRKVTSTPGFVSPVSGTTTAVTSVTSVTGRTLATAKAGRRGRPAQLYRKGPAATLYPPLLRAGTRYGAEQAG